MKKLEKSDEILGKPFVRSLDDYVFNPEDINKCVLSSDVKVFLDMDGNVLEKPDRNTILLGETVTVCGLTIFVEKGRIVNVGGIE